LRPDANADQNTLMPDIVVPAEEALERAVEYLRGLERWMWVSTVNPFKIWLKQTLTLIKNIF